MVIITRLLRHFRLESLLLVAGTLAVLNGIVAFLRIIPWILRGSMDSDVLLYFVVGRGIINGLLPYKDLYETKPPGMFLLSALSLRVTGDEQLLGFLSILVLLTIAVIPAIYVWRMYRNTPRAEKLLPLIISLSGGVLISLYLEHWANGMETELFAALPASLYALTLFLPARKKWTALIIRSALLAVAVGLKEPYLFVTCAVALLSVRSIREFLEVFVSPLLCAAAAGVCILFVLGYFAPYVTLYLPNILRYRLEQDPLNPSILVALDFFPIAYHLFVQFFSSAPSFGLFVTVLWCLVPWSASDGLRAWDAARSLLTGAAVLLAAWSTAMLLTFANAIRVMGHLLPAMYLWPTIIGVCCLVPLLILLSIRSVRCLLPRALLAVFALYVLNYPIVSGGSTGNLLATAVPVYVMLLLLFLRTASTKRTPAIFWSVASLICVALLTFHLTADHLALLEERAGNAMRAHAELIANADAMMDDCQISRFYAFGGPGPFAFSRHAFWGPIPDADLYNTLPDNHPLMKTTMENITNNNLLIFAAPSTGADIIQSIEPYYTLNPPPCAKSFLPLPPYKVWFRRWDRQM